MIEIRTNLTDFVYRYKGNIELKVKEPLLTVEADHVLDAGDMKIDERVFDAFFLVHIISIKGVGDGDVCS